MSNAGERWFIRIQGVVQGPYSIDELRSLIRRGVFRRIHEVSQDRTTWQRAATLANLFEQAQLPLQHQASPPPAIQPVSPPAIPSPTESSLQSPSQLEVRPHSFPQQSNQTESAALAYAVYPADSPPASSLSAPTSSTDPSWYWMRDGVPQGPMSECDLVSQASCGVLQPFDLVWTEGFVDWMPAESTGRFVFPAGITAAGQWTAQPYAQPHYSNLASPISGISINSISRTASSASKLSFILGILGWTLLPLAGSIGAVIFGHSALNELRDGYDVRRRKQAIMGLILGYSAIGTALFAGVVWLVIVKVSRG